MTTAAELLKRTEGPLQHRREGGRNYAAHYLDPNKFVELDICFSVTFEVGLLPVPVAERAFGNHFGDGWRERAIKREVTDPQLGDITEYTLKNESDKDSMLCVFEDKQHASLVVNTDTSEVAIDMFLNKRWSDEDSLETLLSLASVTEANLTQRSIKLPPYDPAFKPEVV
jgi:hypothetical protein